jgi:O-antigen ligase
MKSYSIKADIFLLGAVTVIALNSYLGMIQNEVIGNVIRGGTWLLVFVRYTWYKYAKCEKLSKFMIILLLFDIIYLLKFIIFSNHVITLDFTNLIANTALCCLFDMNLKEKYRIFLKTIIFVYFALLIIEFFIIPNESSFSTASLLDIGEYIAQGSEMGFGRRLYFISGHRNGIFPVLLSKFLVCVYILESAHKIKWFYICLLLALFDIVIAWSATSLVAIILIILTTVFRNKIKTIPLQPIALAIIILNLSIVFFRIQNIFSFLIEGMLHKNLTFTGRTYIWDEYINECFESAITVLFGIKDMDRLFILSTMSSRKPHNFILYLLSTVGVVGIVIMLVLILMTFKTLYFERHTNVAKILSAFIIAYLLMGITETHLAHFLPILYIAYNIRTVISNKLNPVKSSHILFNTTGISIIHKRKGK